MSDRELQEIAGYRLIRRIGAGALGELYEAERRSVAGLDKRVALRRVPAALSADSSLVQRLTSTAELCMRLGHANIARLIEVGREPPEGGSLYIVTEHVGGVSLAELLERGAAPLEAGVVIRIGIEIAKALDHAHRCRDEQGRRLGLVHGELAPSSVFITWDGQLKLTDLALGAVLRDHELESTQIGSRWGYSSPERARGGPAQASGDLFSVGAVLYELLSGENPFERPGPAQTRQALATLKQAPSLPARCGDLPPELAAIVEALLSPKPGSRPASAAALYEALMALEYTHPRRCGPADLASLIEAVASEPPPSTPRFRGLMESVIESPIPEQEPAPDHREELLEARESIPPPWFGTGSLHDATLVVIGGATPLSSDASEALASALRRYGARILALGTDEISAAFGLDHSDGRDAENAARCCLAVLRMFQHTGLGLSCGAVAARLRVDAEGNPAEPRPVEQALEAARALAGRRGWLVVDRRAARQLRRGFDLEPLGREARAWVVEEIKAEPHGPFVGRRQLLRELGERLKQAHGGRLQVLGISGAAGTGKTRLLHELRRRLESDGPKVGWALATCPPRGRYAPMSAMDAMLRTLCGVREGDPALGLQSVEPRLRALGLSDEQIIAVLVELGAPAGAGPSRAAVSPLAPVLAQMFASLARDRLTVLAWDNAQELDDASLGMLTGLVTRLTGARIAFLFAARPDERSGARELTGYSEIALGELDKREARQLVAQRLGVDRVPDRVFSFFHERAGGHAMFLEELVHEAVDSGAILVRHRYLERVELDSLAVPRSLRGAISERIRRLPDPQRNLLSAAALLGAPVDVAVLAETAGMTLGTVNKLIDAVEDRELVRRESFVTIGFPSPLLPEVLVDGLDAELLRTLHRRAADAYRTLLGSDDEITARVAEHLDRSGDPLEAARWFARSGLSRLRAGRHDQAARDLGRALSVCDLGEIGARDAGSWISALAQAIEQVQEGTDLREVAERVEQYVSRTDHGETEARARLLVDLGVILGHTDRLQEARQVLAQAAALAGPWPELSRAAVVAASEIALRRGNFAEALGLLERAGSLGMNSPREQHRLLLTTAQALASVDRSEEAAQALAFAATLAVGDDPLLACERERTRAVLCAFRRDWQGSVEACEAAVEQGRAAGLTREVASSLHNLGEALIRLGEMPRGYAALNASLELAEEANLERIANFDRLLLAHLDAVEGLPGSDELFEEAMARAEQRGWTFDHLTGRYLRGKLLAQRNDFDAARKELEQARQRALEIEYRPLMRECAAELELLEPTIAGLVTR
jgi:eukaryotic-like serine/threonine-protein kinase